MNAPCQLFARRKAAIQSDGVPSVRNFLIIVPEQDGGAIAFDERVKALARRLNKDGYVYVARSSQAEMEDDQFGVRYLPLRQALPSFGIMTAVLVIRDPAWARNAASTYPDADIFLLNPVRASSSRSAGAFLERIPISMILGGTYVSGECASAGDPKAAVRPHQSSSQPRASQPMAESGRVSLPIA